jgi:4-hydroxy-tetrahydrodipicolinate reductase
MPSAPVGSTLPFPFGLEETSERSPGYTANRDVNAVPYVCAARSGIVTSLDLSQIVARFR